MCDTVYDSHITRKDRHVCINVENNKCSYTKQTVYDRTCRWSFSIDCETTPVYAPPPPKVGSLFSMLCKVVRCMTSIFFSPERVRQ